MKLSNTLGKVARVEKQLIKQLLLTSNYWTLNKDVVKLFGLETAFFLSSLAEAENMMADDNGWFYQTAETIEEFTTLSRYKQDKCIEELEKAGILKKEVRGVPAKRYFKLDYESLANQFVRNSQTRMQKTRKLECKKLATNKESSNKEISNKESSNKDIVEQGSTTYPFSEIVEYLNEKAETQYRASSKKTQSLIKARINEGFTLEDFKTVIDKKTTEWKSDNKMNQYLRPETLFGTKFESYLNQKIVNHRSAESGKIVIKKAHDEKPPEVKLTPEERATMIAKIRGNGNE